MNPIMRNNFFLGLAFWTHAPHWQWVDNTWQCPHNGSTGRHALWKP
jgi:hypothetical protein